ncbi:MAG: transposase [Candidatus Zixiibacteriota bacterium]
MCTFGKQKLLTNRRFIEEIIGILRGVADKHSFGVIVYVFMPDHVHLLVRAGDDSDLVSFVKEFKQKAGYHFRRRRRQTLWQKSFYDHIIRKDEEISEITKYILWNPVRKGLVEDAEKYPFSGSFAFGEDIFDVVI